ncbi:DUF2802 domain-containing protein [Aliiglaciecola litoralis]|uniref:DUF2802 domain-containing protein n=2 Tax=Aliiglaciecola litoralis TaxID=582857 RepID=A0ABN1LM21_9ALTE
MALAIALCIVVICVAMTLWLRKTVSLQGKILTDLSKRIDALQHASRLQQEEVHEVRSGALAVGAKVKDLIVKIEHLGDKVAEVEYLDPATRMYTQAAKMVDAGATVEDLMRECELPRAEAELLVSVKKSHS